MFYILNSFSPNMISKEATVSFAEITREEASAILNRHGNDYFSAIGHEGTAKLASNLLYSEIPTNRAQITLNKGDSGLIVTLSFRPEEGKVYDYVELCKLHDEGKIKIYHFKVLFL